MIGVNSSQSEALESCSHDSNARDDLLITERNDRLPQSKTYPEPDWSVAARAVFQWTDPEHMRIDGV
jgi:hypothetical protein